MKKEDLDALAGLYEGVYSPNSGEYLTEANDKEYLSEIPINPGGSRPRGPVTMYGPNDPRRTSSSPYRSRFQSQADVTRRLAAQRSSGYGSGPVVSNLGKNYRGQELQAAARANASQVKPTTTPTTGGSRGGSGASSSSGSSASGSSASRPATPGSAAKVAPSSASGSSASSTKPAGSAMDQWAAANPKLAAAKAERDRTRGTSATTNPLMKDFKDKLPAPKAPSPTTATTAFAKPTPALASSTPAVQSTGTAASAKPTTNQTATAFSSPSLVKPTPSTTPIKKPGAVMASFEWGSKATLKDVADAYKAVYEAKKKDQDQDGDNDFADVRIARMIASGMSKAEAIAAVRNKEYNEEVEILDEAEGSYGATPKAYGAASKTKMSAKRKPFLKKMLSRTNPANRTSPYDSPRKGMTDDDRERARAGSKHGVGTRQDHDYPSEGPGGVTKSAKKLRKQKAMGEFGEAYEIDEATRMRKELGKEGETATRKELAARSKAYKRSGSVDRTIAAAERAADWSGDEKKAKSLRGLASSRRGSVRDKPRAGMKGYAAKVEGGDKDLQSARQRAMSAGTLTPKEKKQLGEIYEIVASYLLENNFAETLNDANVIIENMSEVWLSQILESAE